MNHPKFIQQIGVHLGSPHGKKLAINLKVGFVNGLSAFVTEILFILVPILVLAVIRLYKGTGQSVWAIPEWSFIAAVLFGQAIPRMFEILSELERSFNPRTTSSIAAVVIVLGLIPSLLFLVLILLSDNPSGWLVFGQLVMFALSVATFILSTLVRHVLEECLELAEFLWPEYVEPARKPPATMPGQISANEPPPPEKG